MNSSPSKLGQNRPKQTLNQNSVTPSKRSMYCYMSLPDPIRNGLTRLTISSSFTPMKWNIRKILKDFGSKRVKEPDKRWQDNTLFPYNSPKSMKIATFWSSIPSPSLPTEKSGIFKEHKSTPIAIWSISLILLVSVVNTIVDCSLLAC